MFGVLKNSFVLAALAAGLTYAQPTSYSVVDDWAKLPSDMQWGEVISVDPLPDGMILAFQRADPPLLIFDRSGKLVKSFGDGMFIQPHGLTVDKSGFIWASDGAAKNGKGDQVFKFSPDGKVLMTLGTAGVAGESETTFNGPTDIAIAPNGDIFVSDGHGNNRVVKFSKDGKFIKAWGKKGSGPGEFNVPHTLAFDSHGRLYVGDRSNSRIQIFDQDGNFIEEWKQFGRPSGIFITPDDTILVADSDSDTAKNPGWKRGIRIGNVKDGKVTALIPEVGVDPDSKKRSYPKGPAEGVMMDSAGDVYGAEVISHALKKYVKK
jgi:DNA-binding beta-propeller fold protein YncE